MTRDDLLTAIRSPNVAAFLRVIREGESNQTEAAWTVLYGGGHFESFDDHPRIRFPITYQGKPNYTTAAGAFQIVERTWNDFTKAFGPMPFSVQNQTLCAVWRLAYRKALDDVLAGRIDEAIRKCIDEWTSLGLPRIQARAAQVYEAFGGRIASADRPAPTAPDPVVAAPAQPAKGGFMAPLVIPILSALSSLIPQLGSLFGSGSEVANRNIAAGTILAKTITEATQSVNLQEAAERIRDDPVALRAAQAAVAEVWSTVVEGGGGGIDGARKAAASADGDWRKVVFTFPFMFAAVLVPLIYAVVLAALLKAPWLAEFTPDARMMVITAIINLALGSLIGYAYGTTLGSQKKDAMIAGSRP